MNLVSAAKVPCWNKSKFVFVTSLFPWRSQLVGNLALIRSLAFWLSFPSAALAPLKIIGYFDLFALDCFKDLYPAEFQHPLQKMWAGSVSLSMLVMPPDRKHLKSCKTVKSANVGQTSRQESKVPGWWRIMLLSCPAGGTFIIILDIDDFVGEILDRYSPTVNHLGWHCLVFYLNNDDTLAEASNILSAGPLAWKRK